jgi:hypothetical protein
MIALQRPLPCSGVAFAVHDALQGADLAEQDEPAEGLLVYPVQLS